MAEMAGEAAFAFGSKVRVDGKGRGTITAASYVNNRCLYNVHIEGTATHVKLPPSRLTLIPSTVSTPPAFNTMYRNDATDDEPPTKVSKVNKPEENRRFQKVSDDDIQGIITEQSNKNTLQKTLYDLKLLREYFQNIGESREIADIPPEELGPILCKFFISVRKADGSNYEPSSLRGFMSSFDRQLRRKNYGHSLTSDVKFAQMREVLKSKQKELKREGKGNLPNKRDNISDDDVERFWESGQFGTSSPESVINSLWFFNSVYFGMRGAQEHRDMCWSDIELNTDSNGVDFLQFNERQTKTRTGANPRDIRKVKPKMWSNQKNPDRCPVKIYRFYASKRPADYCAPDSPFYIATSTNFEQFPDAQWFKRQPIGPKKLTGIVSQMVEKAGIQTHRKLSNTSARKHLLQKLKDNGIPSEDIMQISGHRNIQSVNSYSQLNENQHKHIFDVLSSRSPLSEVNTNSGTPVSSLCKIAPKMASATACTVPEHVTDQRGPQLTTSRPPTSPSSTSQSQSNSVYNIFGGLNTLFSGSMYGGNVQVHIYPASHDHHGTQK